MSQALLSQLTLGPLRLCDFLQTARCWPVRVPMAGSTSGKYLFLEHVQIGSDKPPGIQLVDNISVDSVPIKQVCITYSLQNNFDIIARYQRHHNIPGLTVYSHGFG